ncbi:MAG: hypothetical protein IJQ93_03980 [Bacteroidales bacterium]|nr:hypothetical protein [Bacteroidales bacterium]
MKYIDLGLPSGTLWAEEDEKEQMSKRNINRKPDIIVPTKKQWDELDECCKISVDESQKTATVTGPNGNSITFGLKQQNKRLISEAYISSTKCIVPKQELYYCSIIRYEKEAYLKKQLNTNHVAEPEQTLAIRTVAKREARVRYRETMMRQLQENSSFKEKGLDALIEFAKNSPLCQKLKKAEEHLPTTKLNENET